MVKATVSCVFEGKFGLKGIPNRAVKGLGVATMLKCFFFFKYQIFFTKTLSIVDKTKSCECDLLEIC